MTASAAGLPQIVMPLFAFDQFLHAQRVDGAGAGIQLPGGPDADAEGPEVVRKLLAQPRFADGARSVAAEIAALPDVGTSVEVLQDLAGKAPASPATWASLSTFRC